jgi:DNA-binding NtrC family response regulator
MKKQVWLVDDDAEIRSAMKMMFMWHFSTLPLV